MIHQTINWPNQRVPVFLCDVQCKLTSTAKLSNRSSFLAAFSPRYAVLPCRPVETNLTVRGDRVSSPGGVLNCYMNPRSIFVKEGVSRAIPRGGLMTAPSPPLISRYHVGILGLQPRDKATMLGVGTIELFSRRIYMKMEVTSRRNEMLFFLTTNQHGLCDATCKPAV